MAIKITCIQPQVQSLLEIKNLGYLDGGIQKMVTRERLHDWLKESTSNQAYTLDPTDSSKAYLETKTNGSTKYVKTKGNDNKRDNLLSLPFCK